MKLKNNIKMSLSIFVCFVIFLFMTISVYATQSAVNLGTAEDFVILAKSGVSTTGTTSIIGNIGVSPIDSTALTGFGVIMDSSNEFATSSLITGKLYAADYTSSTSTKMTTAISDMQTAYTDAAGRTETNIVTELGAGDISGLTITPGLYKWGTGVMINTGVTLSGNSSDIWIFQIAQDLDVGNGAIITLNGGAQAKNIFWQVGGQTTLGTTSDMKGIILSQTAIAMNTGATLNGRLLSQTAVTLDANIISSPSSTPSSDSEDLDDSAEDSSSSSGDETSSDGSEDRTYYIQDSKASDDASNDDSISNVIKTEVSRNADSVTVVTKPKEIVNIVTGVSTTITKNGANIELISSENGKTKLKSGNVNVETRLSVEVEGDIIRVTKSNGIKAEIKTMPIVASETAIAKLKLNFCTEENTCTIILKEVGTGSETRIEYSVKAHKDVKILGLFRAKMNVEANVDAETNEVTSTKIPWWSSISTDVN